MSEVNIPLLRKAVEWVEAEAAKPPELCEWYQPEIRVTPEERAAEVEWGWGVDLKRAPECGTCYCIAGYVVALEQPAAFDSHGEGSLCDLANDLLGLGRSSHRLFAMNNNIEDVRRIAEELAGERL